MLAILFVPKWGPNDEHLFLLHHLDQGSISKDSATYIFTPGALFMNMD